MNCKYSEAVLCWLKEQVKLRAAEQQICRMLQRSVRIQLARFAFMEPLDQITILSTISLIPPTVFPADCNNAVSYVWNNIKDLLVFMGFWNRSCEAAYIDVLKLSHGVLHNKASCLILWVFTLLFWGEEGVVGRIYVFKKNFFCLCMFVFSTHEIIRLCATLLLTGFLISAIISNESWYPRRYRSGVYKFRAPRRLIFMSFQYGTFSISPLWRVEF